MEFDKRECPCKNRKKYTSMFLNYEVFSCNECTLFVLFQILRALQNISKL